ncbi:CHAT domain-containing protein [Pontibacter pamirensis]|uniref:CHAT domain-containing protein n=1 Tax=Pontibacter pamirensis TaxID=2562824 RepID=UPI00138994AA|nr:CHAT domain-containing protein [Pontibacter pamirensis]
MRTITLELLRHGPAHNQLLSPLTPYLALCQNHGANTLHVPFEHNQFLFRLNALDYKHNEEARTFQLKDTARVLGEFLAQIPGLTAESSKEEATKEQLTHLRLILSASELALLPFEMAISPNGFPGAGQHLLLQPQLPICLTREIRRVGENLFWPEKHRILFVAASPPGVDAIPLESHLLTLRRAVEPWMKYFEHDDNDLRQKHVEEHLVFLPEASVEAIEDKCASGEFSHVHILAHGVEQKENFDTRFFLALHNSSNPQQTDFISGPRLAAALRASNRVDGKGLAKPMVVTLASCNSGGVGSVAGAGASIAHALHESGIPIVVASQFPLSFKGSVRLVECLYEGLLSGKDPRWLLYDLRRRLFSQFPDTHDWASLIAYVSLPTDFNQQLPSTQIDRARLSIEAAMNHADEVSRTSSDKIETKSNVSVAAKIEVFREAMKKIVDAKKKLEKMLDGYPNKSSEINGLLASVEKRQAEILFCKNKIKQPSPAEEKDSTKQFENTSGDTLDPELAESLQLLCSSRSHYWDAFQSDRSKSWAVVQYLSLTLVICNSELFKKIDLGLNELAISRPERKPEALWSLARLISEYDLHCGVRQHKIWAHANLLELYLLSFLLKSEGQKIKAETEGTPSPMDKKDDLGAKNQFNIPGNEEARRCAIEHAYSLVEISGRDSISVYTTRRQIRRYLEWFNFVANAEGKPLEAKGFKNLAEDIFNLFPKEVEDKFK